MIGIRVAAVSAFCCGCQKTASERKVSVLGRSGPALLTGVSRCCLVHAGFTRGQNSDISDIVLVDLNLPCNVFVVCVRGLFHEAFVGILYHLFELLKFRQFVVVLVVRIDLRVDRQVLPNDKPSTPDIWRAKHLLDELVPLTVRADKLESDMRVDALRRRARCQQQVAHNLRTVMVEHDPAPFDR